MDLIITILPVVTNDLPISPRFTPYDFLSRCKFSTLRTRQPMIDFYLLTFPRFPLRKKEHKSYFGKNRTHDFRTSRCAVYLLDLTATDITTITINTYQSEEGFVLRSLSSPACRQDKEKCRRKQSPRHDVAYASRVALTCSYLFIKRKQTSTRMGHEKRQYRHNHTDNHSYIRTIWPMNGDSQYVVDAATQLCNTAPCSYQLMTDYMYYLLTVHQQQTSLGAIREKSPRRG